jgi:hypothetical protein
VVWPDGDLNKGLKHVAIQPKYEVLCVDCILVFLTLLIKNNVNSNYIQQDMSTQEKRFMMPHPTTELH